MLLQLQLSTLLEAAQDIAVMQLEAPKGWALQQQKLLHFLLPVLGELWLPRSRSVHGQLVCRQQTLVGPQEQLQEAVLGCLGPDPCSLQ